MYFKWKIYKLLNVQWLIFQISILVIFVVNLKKKKLIFYNIFLEKKLFCIH